MSNANFVVVKIVIFLEWHMKLLIIYWFCNFIENFQIFMKDLVYDMTFIKTGTICRIVSMSSFAEIDMLSIQTEQNLHRKEENQSRYDFFPWWNFSDTTISLYDCFVSSLVEFVKIHKISKTWLYTTSLNCKAQVELIHKNNFSKPSMFEMN